MYCIGETLRMSGRKKSLTFDSVKMFGYFKLTFLAAHVDFVLHGLHTVHSHQIISGSFANFLLTLLTWVHDHNRSLQATNYS